VLLVALLGSLAIFGAVRSLPGDAVALRMKSPDPERVAAVRAELGLDDAWGVQYRRYVERFVRGEWGSSLASGRPVRAELGEALAATLELTVVALIFGAVGGAALILASRAFGRRGPRQAARTLGALGLTVPVFVVGLCLLGLAAWAARVWGWDWLPTGGRWSWGEGPPPAGGTGMLVWDALQAGRLDAAWVALRHLLLPGLALSLYPAALVAGTLEARLADPRIEVLQRALKARGFGPWRIWGWHLPRLLGAPLVTVLGTNFGGLLGGAVMTETVFSWPGVGRLLVQAVLGRDVFVIENGLLAIVLLALLVTAVADLVASALLPTAAEEDPR